MGTPGTLSESERGALNTLQLSLLAPHHINIRGNWLHKSRIIDTTRPLLCAHISQKWRLLHTIHRQISYNTGAAACTVGNGWQGQRMVTSQMLMHTQEIFTRLNPRLSSIFSLVRVMLSLHPFPYFSSETGSYYVIQLVSAGLKRSFCPSLWSNWTHRYTLSIPRLIFFSFLLF